VNKQSQTWATWGIWGTVSRVLYKQTQFRRVATGLAVQTNPIAPTGRAGGAVAGAYCAEQTKFFARGPAKAPAAGGTLLYKQTQLLPSDINGKYFVEKELRQIRHARGPGKKPNLRQTDRKWCRQAGPEGLPPVERSCTNKPNFAWLGQSEVPAGGKMRNKPNLPLGGLGPAEPIAPNKANFPPEGVGRELVLSLPKERPTLDQVEAKLHEEPRAIVPNKANSRLRRAASAARGCRGLRSLPIVRGLPCGGGCSYQIPARASDPTGRSV
jgi:hypothetical protein